MIPAYVTIGVGAWTVSASVKLIACPHVGDTIDVKGITVNCQRVHITAREVFVSETIRFQSEAQLNDYVNQGWTR